MGLVRDAWRHQPSVRHTAKVLLAAAAAFIVANQLNAGREGGRWVEAGSVEEVREAEVVYVREHGVFVVATEGGFLALTDDARHLRGERVLFCRSSGWFEAPTHGEQFDRFGTYAGGPAMANMNRVAVRVEDGRVLVDPRAITVSAGRGGRPLEGPQEAPCVGPPPGGVEWPPGFFTK